MKRIAQAYPSLSAFEKKLELPMLFVTFAWLFVLIIELVYGTTAALSAFGTSIWVIFILYFGLRLTISGSRRSFLRKNWIVVLAILASVLRLIPFLQSFGCSSHRDAFARGFRGALSGLRAITLARTVTSA